ncbi:hypothetical protein B0H19DRAFT_421583 [Mycena capillaripes]|nr:hypothetical protein B0H19DRAFT_421583 [Mycena capillaripes]
MRANIQLISTVLLGSLSLIPSDILRYTALASAIALALVYNLRPNPATCLDQLEESIRKTEDIFERAKSNCACPRDQFSLTQEWVRLLEVKRSTSKMHCRILESERLTWRQYWHLNQRVTQCANSVATICTAIQLVVEYELQRKLTEDINETQSILMNSRSTCTACQAAPVQANTSDGYICAFRLGSIHNNLSI